MLPGTQDISFAIEEVFGAIEAINKARRLQKFGYQTRSDSEVHTSRCCRRNVTDARGKGGKR